MSSIDSQWVLEFGSAYHDLVIQGYSAARYQKRQGNEWVLMTKKVLS